MSGPPTRSAIHESMDAFLGRWTATGTSYGGTDQSGVDPKANGQSWHSTYECFWHTGRYFLVQDERADIAGMRFDTLSIMGVDEGGAAFIRGFENHGFQSLYRVTKSGDEWRFEGASERAKIVFSENFTRQTIAWEWKPEGTWLPLCDRVASRVD